MTAHRMTAHRWWAEGISERMLLAVAVMVLLLIAACGPGGAGAGPVPVTNPGPPPAGEPTPTPQTVTPTPTPMPPSQPDPAESSLPPLPQGESSAEFRVLFNLAVQEHSYLLAEAVFAAVGGRESEALAARAVLQQENTPLIRDLVGQGISATDRDRFINEWHAWTLTVEDYALALQSGNTERTSRIWGDRFRQGERLAAPLAEGLDYVDRDLLVPGFQQHVELTLGMVSIMHQEAAIDGYWGAWYTTDFTRLAGEVLAEGVVRQAPHHFDVATTRTGSATLETELSMRMHEYVLLLMNGTAAIIDGRLEGDARAARETLDYRNSIPFARFIGTFRPDLEEEFLEAWRQHTYAVYSYASQMNTGDDEALEVRRGRLQAELTELARLFAAIAPQTDRAEWEDLLHRHGDLLLETVARQHAGASEDRYLASLTMARQSQPLALALHAALAEEYAGRLEIEDTLHSMIAAWNDGEAGNYLAYWTDQGIRSYWGVERAAASAQLGSQAGTTSAMLQRVVGVSVNGSNAEAEWVVISGIALQRMRASLVNENGEWRIASAQMVDAPIPSGANRTIAVTVGNGGLTFDRTVINGGYIGFRARNVSQQACELRLFRLPSGPSAASWDGTTANGAIAKASTIVMGPGQTGSMGFVVPLEAAQYGFACYENGQPVPGTAATFGLPYES